MPNLYVIGLLSLGFMFSGLSALAQQVTKRVLFIGNSYTYVNNLPQMVADVTASAGDSLFFDSNTPGGYTFQQHSANATTINKISTGSWDYVVLQEQSQLPSFPIGQVEAACFPYAYKLDSMINAGNPCAETVFFMTWGRKNGDASNCGSWPPVCTYEGMDSLLNLRYRMIADSNDAILSPVGAVWHYIRQNFPAIELYNADESHPSVAGSYAAACCFYSVLFRKAPALITFNSSLSVADAENIRDAVKMIVYDSLMSWHIGEYDPSAGFTYSISAANQVTFANSSNNSDNYFWNFGDGATSIEAGPVHTYANSGSYNVMLIAARCGLQDTFEVTIDVAPMGVVQKEANQVPVWNIYPNPANDVINLKINELGAFYYRIVNLSGQEIKSGAINNTGRPIDVSSLADGLYFFQLVGNNMPIGQKKFIKRSD